MPAPGISGSASRCSATRRSTALTRPDARAQPPLPLPDITDFSYDSAELNESLDRLGSESRLMLSMSVLGGYTSGEIAELCGMKASTVRSRLSRIKQQLRIALSDEGAVCERQAKGEWL